MDSLAPEVLQWRQASAVKKKKMAEASTTVPDASSSPAPEEKANGSTLSSTTKSIAELAEDVQRTVMESRETAIRSARNLQRNSSTHLQSLQVSPPTSNCSIQF